MKELFYFSKSDLMVQVQYNKDTHALRYASHRKINDGEKGLVEKYITENVANETKNPEYSTAAIDYTGVDFKLINHLNQFHAVKSLKKPGKAKGSEAGEPLKSLIRKDIDSAVKDLIKTSMKNYYFEKIGSTLVEARKKSENGARTEELKEYNSMLEELVNAYNSYSRKKVSFKDVLPAELCA